MICRSFEPVLTPDARVMIVGSMPSVKSLADAQYYAHPRNAFWPILFDIWGVVPHNDYERKKAMLREHGVALWDAAACCEREGSLDSSMRGVVYNDFSRVYAVCPRIGVVLCNGGTAGRLYHRWLEPQSGLAAQVLPSTSPANAAWGEERLVAAWSEVLLPLRP